MSYLEPVFYIVIIMASKVFLFIFDLISLCNNAVHQPLIYYWILFRNVTKAEKGFKWISYFDVFIIF